MKPPCRPGKRPKIRTETANAYFLQNDHLKKKKLYVLHGYVDTYSGYDFWILTTRLNNNGNRIKVGEKYTFHLYQIYGKDVVIYPQNSDYTVGGIVYQTAIIQAQNKLTENDNNQEAVG